MQGHLLHAFKALLPHFCCVKRWHEIDTMPQHVHTVQIRWCKLYLECVDSSQHGCLPSEVPAHTECSERALSIWILLVQCCGPAHRLCSPWHDSRAVERRPCCTLAAWLWRQRCVSMPSDSTPLFWYALLSVSNYPHLFLFQIITRKSSEYED